MKAAFYTATHTGATREVQRTVWGQEGPALLCPKSSRRSQCSWLPLAPSLPPDLGSSTEGLAEPAWEATGKVQAATPTGWWRPDRKGRVGRGWFRLNRSYIQPLPPAVRAGFEPSWLWDCDTVQFSKALWELAFSGLLTLPQAWAGTGDTALP